MGIWVDDIFSDIYVPTSLWLQRYQCCGLSDGYYILLDYVHTHTQLNFIHQFP